MKRQLQAPDSDLPLIAEPLSLSEPDDDLTLASNAGLSICCIRAALLLNLAKKRGHEIFAVSIADIDKALAPKVHTDPATKVPAEYHDLLDVFSKENSDRLPERRLYDHKIKLEEGKQYRFSPLYSMS